MSKSLLQQLRNEFQLLQRRTRIFLSFKRGGLMRKDYCEITGALLPNDRLTILKLLEPLFEQAVKNRKWFYCSYQGMIFSPRELRDRHNKGELIWGPVNWQLIDPPMRRDLGVEIRELTERVLREDEELKKRIKKGWDL